MQLLIDIPDVPAAALSPNAKAHWGQRSKTVRIFRDMANLVAFATLTAEYPEFREGERAIPDGRIDIHWEVHWPPRRHRWDTDNLALGLKPMQDGIADALGVNDRRFYLTGIDQFRSKAPRTVAILTFKE